MKSGKNMNVPEGLSEEINRPSKISDTHSNIMDQSQSKTLLEQSDIDINQQLQELDKKHFTQQSIKEEELESKNDEL